MIKFSSLELFKRSFLSQRNYLITPQAFAFHQYESVFFDYLRLVGKIWSFKLSNILSLPHKRDSSTRTSFLFVILEDGFFQPVDIIPVT